MSAREAASPQAREPLSFRDEFPIFERRVHGKPLVYLDSAATSQKPQTVIAALERFYSRECSNVHRGIHLLSAEATVAYEGVREKTARFINAASADEIVFTSGTTAAINLVAHSFGERFVRAGDELLVTEMEHHSNLVPWQLLCRRTGARLRVAGIADDGALRVDELESLIGPRTRIVAVTHTSNALGTRNPLRRIIDAAHAAGVPVLVDGAQAMAHEAVDVRELDCDLFAFSGHKMFGPTGTGVLYGKAELLEQLPPFIGGGEMIETVTLEGASFKPPPHRFEAGTPHIAGVIGLGAAIDWLDTKGLDVIARHDADLLDYATRRLSAVDRVRLVGTAADKASIVSFTVEGIHSHDVGQWLDDAGVAVRAGQHCAQPVMERFGLQATVRASLACYNTRHDIDVLVRALERTIEVLG